MREVIADIREAVGDVMAIALRVSLDETIGDLGFSNAELRDFVEMNRNLPDIWDLARGTWEDCSGPRASRRRRRRRTLVRGIQALTDAPGGGGRPLHLARRDGAADHVRACST
ncbi:MAG: hypothetical protein KatS3mg118_2601 [Paracoccaceae bacterium]|nr:MAG: hypothetical protein KatS3mg118_2601 [Paracoccaceae bacterium]